ncbi:T9SS type A sorting domain-containing protein [Hymenobacter metallicola]|uniref:T9SS type A sorting domain-containing protein n=1 Tax=Hymenobacter metallicola TaxID=2563114 RepID=UPI0014367471|nr:T9SS type A sorting domain-containing protein [Hymenobacter metallicola]
MAVSQPDGKRLVLGNFVRPETRTSVLLLRFNADNTVDETFTGNVATLRGSVTNVRVLPSGKLLLIGDGALTIGGLSRQDLLLLNADGSADPGFDAGVASGAGRARISAVQPDGKILLGGTFTTYNGIAAQRIVRLLPTGAVDASFSAGTQLNDAVQEITLQPDGKILVGGDFDFPAAIARLLPNGTLDTSFSSPLTNKAKVVLIGVQPNGNILVGDGGFGLPFADGSTRLLGRLLPSGAVDPSFSEVSTAPTGSVRNRYDASEFIVQADGRIMAPMYGLYAGSATKALIRVNPDGSRDTGFVPPAGTEVSSLQDEPNGQVLVSGLGVQQEGRRNSVVVLTGSGAINSSFNPVVLKYGSIHTMASQADGKIIAAGDFDEVDGVRVKGLTRFNPDGTIDSTFPTQTANPFDVQQIAVQPDGKILISGSWLIGNMVGSPQIMRLLATGAVDATFQPEPGTYVDRFVVQPDGGIVIDASFGRLKRLLPNGQPDNSFISGQLGHNQIIRSMAVQPDGKILVGGSWDTYNSTTVSAMVRLLPNGALDPSFSSPVQTTPGIDIHNIRVQPDGKILVGSYVDNSLPATLPFRLARLLPSGAIDASFSPVLPVNNQQAIDWFTDLAVQPNGRILVIGIGSDLLRLMPDGQPDATFSGVDFNYSANALLVQPDGKILVAGAFEAVNMQTRVGLVRLTAPNVLHVTNAQLDARTQAWPVPARGELNLALDATARPESVQLLDNLGRTALTQPAPQPTLTLPLRHVKAGVYLLRVNYADGPVTRRVVVE